MQNTGFSGNRCTKDKKLIRVHHNFTTMIDKIKFAPLFKRPTLHLENMFTKVTPDVSFDSEFFDFSDRLYPWTTVYRYMLFQSFEKDIQLMVGMGQKNISHYRVNGIKTIFDSSPPEYRVGLSYWCYSDGLIHEIKNEVIWNNGNVITSPTLDFQRTEDRYVVNIREIDTNINMQDCDGYDFLRFKFLLSPFYRCNKYLPFRGRILGEKIKGMALMQKVNINMPFIPWLWGRSFFEDGSKLDFYEPRVLKPLYKSLNFQIDGKEYKFIKRTKIEMIPDGVYPVWRLYGETGRGEELEVEIKSYGHICNNFETKKTCFSYNQYPSKVTDLKLKRKGDTITLDDLGNSAANCENSYYSRIF